MGLPQNRCPLLTRERLVRDFWRAYENVDRVGEHSFWQPIEAAWVQSDGESFNLKLHYMPAKALRRILASV
jgi:hypothetical protein